MDIEAALHYHEAYAKYLNGIEPIVPFLQTEK